MQEINVNFNLVQARDVDEVKELLTDMPTDSGREAILEKPVKVAEGEIVSEK